MKVNTDTLVDMLDLSSKHPMYTSTLKFIVAICGLTFLNRDRTATFKIHPVVAAHISKDAHEALNSEEIQLAVKFGKSKGKDGDKYKVNFKGASEVKGAPLELKLCSVVEFIDSFAKTGLLQGGHHLIIPELQTLLSDRANELKDEIATYDAENKAE